MSEPRHAFTVEEARRVGDEVGIDWASAPFDADQFRIGMNVELEHGLHDPLTNVSDDDPHVTAKIALAHLNEFPDYYTRLERMEEEAKRDWEQRPLDGVAGPAAARRVQRAKPHETNEKGRARIHQAARSRGPHRRAYTGSLPCPARRQAAPEGKRNAVHAAVLARHDPLAQSRAGRAAEARHRPVAARQQMPKPADLSVTGLHPSQ